MIQEDEVATKVVAKMMQNDLFSQWMNIEVIKVREGYCKMTMTLRDEMINGFEVIHGGIIFSFADSAFAFACNNRNNLSFALEASISFNKASKPGDVIIAEAKEIHNGRSTGLYIITVTNQNND